MPAQDLWFVPLFVPIIRTVSKQTEMFLRRTVWCSESATCSCLTAGNAGCHIYVSMVRRIRKLPGEMTLNADTNSLPRSANTRDTTFAFASEESPVKRMRTTPA